MRLIDVDKMLDDMKKELEKAVNDENLDKDERMVILTSAIALKDFVNRQPTAYDVNKVVSELERKRDFHYKQMETVDFENDIFAQHIYEEEHNRGIGLNKAIEIVKAGGTDE